MLLAFGIQMYLNLAFRPVFRYLSLKDILLTERYITNEGLLPWYFITSPLAERNLNLALTIMFCILKLMNISLLLNVCQVILFYSVD